MAGSGAHRVACVLGFGLLAFAAYATIQWREELLADGEDPGNAPPLVAVATMLAGSAFCTYGAFGIAGEFSPIHTERVGRAKVPEAHVYRPAFISFNTRQSLLPPGLTLEPRK